MLFKRKQPSILLLTIASLSFALAPADCKPTSKQENSCLSFVQNFYNWYANIANQQNGPDPLGTALNQKRSVFSSALYNQLQEDRKAQDKVTGEIVGLDFDPILSTNAEPARNYTVKNVRAKGNGLLVDVYGQFSDSRAKSKVTSPELIPNAGSWKFVNFHYDDSSIPENKDLVSILTTLRKARGTK